MKATRLMACMSAFVLAFLVEPGGRSTAFAQSLPPDFSGKITYDGTALGRRDMPASNEHPEPRSSAISGAYSVDIEYDGNTVKGLERFNGTPNDRLVGTRTGTTCNIADGRGRRWAATCSGSEFGYHIDASDASGHLDIVLRATAAPVPGGTYSMHEGQCQQGDARECSRAGSDYFHGAGGPANLPFAADRFKRACDGGYGGGCAGLGHMYAEGIGFAKNLNLAASLFIKGCKPGHDMRILSGDACAYLGQLHEKGLIVNKDMNEAVELYRDGCGQAIVQPCIDLARIYLAGLSAKVDDDFAYEASQKAVRIARGEADSQMLVKAESFAARVEAKMKGDAKRLFAPDARSDIGCLEDGSTTNTYYQEKLYGNDVARIPIYDTRYYVQNICNYTLEIGISSRPAFSSGPNRSQWEKLSPQEKMYGVSSGEINMVKRLQVRKVAPKKRK